MGSSNVMTPMRTFSSTAPSSSVSPCTRENATRCSANSRRFVEFDVVRVRRGLETHCVSGLGGRPIIRF
uniref:Cold-shock (CSD) domain-containing protein n=1 Tax=Globodera rostochiensis TaxID=31243 RepID=A0A914HZF2_GLORO